MKRLVVIPARYASTRFPGKPLADMNGKPMIQRVYEQCLKSKADLVIVSTDNEEIAERVTGFGGVVYLTDTEFSSGTERVIHTAMNLPEEYDVIVNVQGDEPFIDPADIDTVFKMVKRKPTVISTLVTKLKVPEMTDRNVVKCLIGDFAETIMYTRSPIYYELPRNLHKHIGIYGFSRNTLETLYDLKVRTPNEEAENLEQLRWLDCGLEIHASYTSNDSVGIDTVRDLVIALQKL